jgi:steroid delta-isomerase-like uncharacterized protein
VTAVAPAGANTALILRFYEELWNNWDLPIADEILAPEVHFRGTLGTTGVGIKAFKGYVERVRAAFPDWHNRVDELIAAGEKVVARLTWSGTHDGELLGVPPTGRRVTYAGVGIFELRDGRICAAWVVGDTQELWKALGMLSFAPGTS